MKEKRPNFSISASSSRFFIVHTHTPRFPLLFCHAPFLARDEKKMWCGFVSLSTFLNGNLTRICQKSSCAVGKKGEERRKNRPPSMQMRFSEKKRLWHFSLFGDLINFQFPAQKSVVVFLCRYKVSKGQKKLCRFLNVPKQIPWTVQTFFLLLLFLYGTLGDVACVVFFATRFFLGFQRCWLLGSFWNARDEICMNFRPPERDYTVFNSPFYQRRKAD